tara:strand:- start:1833 stop:4241 length:2409 start_codon:yes stop_codon:yes gene_type:complete
MPIEKNNDLPAGNMDVEIEDVEAGEMPDIEIILDDEGGAEINIGEEEDEVPFDANLAEVLDSSVLAQISSELMPLFEADQGSRKDWEEQYGKGLKLLGFTFDERTRPFKGAAAATHPLLTEAIVQFQAQALKELMPAEGPVRTQVLGKETREKLMQADRVRDFMNYQITDVMEEYTPDFDQLLFYTGYGGSAFKKVYYDEDKQRMVSKLILPDNLYIPYNGSSVMSECARITHVVPMSVNDYRKAVLRGQYLDTAEERSSADMGNNIIQKETDRVTKMSPNADDEEMELLEFQIDWDLEGFEHVGDDGEPTGLRLPYVITIDKTSGATVGVRRNWKEGDDLYRRKQYYVHYMLVQGLGAYGLGFLHLVGGLSQAATAAMRQLIDAGTLANLPAGFKAKGARIMNDDVPLQPGEFRDIDAGGVELSQTLMPLPYKEPSQTLFALLGFCADAGRRLASVTDMQVGDSNQNAAVGTTIALLEKGGQVMSAIHKRLHYSQKIEFKLLAKGFGEYLPDEYPYDVPGETRSIKRKDFDDRIDVLPVSDPNIFSVAQRITMAQTQLQLAQSNPQMHNMYEAYRRMYQAIGVRDIDQILNTQNVDKPKDPASENSQALDGSPLKAFAGQQHDAHMMSHLMFALSPTMASMPQVTVTIQKHIFEHIRLKAEESTEAELFTQYGVDPEGIVSALQREAMIAIKVAEFYQEAKKMQTDLQGPPADDPLVKVKEQEIQAKTTADAADDSNDKARIQLEGQRVQGDLMVDKAKVALDTQKLQQQGSQNAAQNSQAQQNAQLQALSRAQKGNSPQR